MEAAMSIQQPLVIDYLDWPKFLINPPLLTSFQSGWNSIQLAHYCHPSLDVPEISNYQHVVLIPIGNHKIDLEFVAEGHPQTVSYREQDYANYCIEIYPADLPISLHSLPTVKSMELIKLYLEPIFVAQIAYESVNPDQV